MQYALAIDGALFTNLTIIFKTVAEGEEDIAEETDTSNRWLNENLLILNNKITKFRLEIFPSFFVTVVGRSEVDIVVFEQSQRLFSLNIVYLDKICLCWMSVGPEWGRKGEGFIT